MLSKSKIIYCCSNCGAKFPKWMGQCTQCGEWNSISEEVIRKKKSNESFFKENSVREITTINSCEKDRITFNDNEFNRVLGGGIVKGSVILISGEPGIGKSTILLQNSINSNEKVLYISGEESAEQLNLRSKRISNNPKNCFVLTETNIEIILKNIEKTKPELIVVDSIQTIQTDMFDNSQGSTTQIKECTSILIKLAKHIGIPIIIVGHITKDGNIAGPKILEHMVDVVLHFEGDKHHQFRILRSKKNRFGSTNEIGIYEMNERGLQMVLNPSELFISKKESLEPGTSVAVSLDGDRSIMIEVQALVSSAVYGTPQRISNGFNSKRLNMLLAVLQKRAGIQLSNKDVFLNITGGIKSEDPSLDLAVVSAILSSYHDTPLNEKICFASEIGLSGELRSVIKLDKRISEAEKLGYEVFVTSRFKKEITRKNDIKILEVEKIESLITNLFK